MNTVSTFGTAGYITPPPSCNPLTVDAGPDQNVVFGAVVALAGSVSAQGIREDQTLTTLWTATGPGTAVFSDPTALNPTVTFSVPGTYVLTLTAYTDPCAPVSDSMVVAMNGAPVVDAGPNQFLQFGASTSLAGVVADDGLPAPAAISLLWSQVSGPGVARLSNPRVLAPSVSFPQVGVYVLRLTASDGQLSASDTVQIESDAPPVVNAGPDQIVPFPGSATLAGTVTGAGFTHGPVTHQWHQVAGPAPVTFSDPSSLTSTVTFPVSGVYVLTLTATDGFLSALDPITITANAAPVVSAGGDRLVAFGSAVQLNGTATDDGLPLPAMLSRSWSKTSGPGTVTFIDASSLTPTVTLSAPGAYVLTLTANDGNRSTSDSMVLKADTAPNVVAGPDQNINFGSGITLAGSVSDDGLPTGTVTHVWSKTSGPGTVTFSNAAALNPTVNLSVAGVYVLTLTASDGFLDSSASLTIRANAAPTVNAGSDQAVRFGNAVRLAGTVSDDGLPINGTLTHTWSKVSGPGTATFANQSALSTTVNFSVSGTYVLRLSANDGALTASDTLIVSANAAPVVDAGDNQNINFGGDAVLNGSVNDDGLPNGGNLSFAWSQDSGPSTASFDDNGSLSPTVSFAVPGVYVLRLTASDGSLTASDTVSIGVNSAPVVNAGTNRIVTLGSTATMSATASDDGLPFGSSLALQWSQDSGPAQASFSDATALNPVVSFPVSGVYQLRLAASDGALSSFDTVQITANAAPVVSAGPNKSGAVGFAVALNGSATDDGFPVGSTLSHIWSIVSGPGAGGTFSDVGSLTPTFTANAAGSFVLRLTASDGSLTASSTCSVTAAVNQPPTVNAGPDQNVVTGATITLAGSASDDGLPNNTLTHVWSKTSGPGNVTFSNVNSYTPTVTVSANGIYVLTLTANDGAATASDDMTLTVSAPVVLLGAHPLSPLIQGSDGGLYGIAAGQVYSSSYQTNAFRLGLDGSVTNLHQFYNGDGSGAGYGSDAALTQGSDGNFYGVQPYGASDGGEVVFKLTPSGVMSVVANLPNSSRYGRAISSLLLGSDGNLYGGMYGYTPGFVGDTNYIYKITPAGVFSILYTFTSDSVEGYYLHGEILVQGDDGFIYCAVRGGGVNGTGGSGNTADGGTILKVSTAGVATVFYSFAIANPEGCSPLHLTKGPGGNFYGITAMGGTNGYGTIFKMTPAGVVTVLYNFVSGFGNYTPPITGYYDPSVSEWPLSPTLAFDGSGNIYGCTYQDGTNGYGTVFKITPGGVFTVLHAFAQTDGINPTSGLTRASDGNFYGTCWRGGPNGSSLGTVFKITPSGTFSVLQPFTG